VIKYISDVIVVMLNVHMIKFISDVLVMM